MAIQTSDHPQRNKTHLSLGATSVGEYRHTMPLIPLATVYDCNIIVWE